MSDNVLFDNFSNHKAGLSQHHTNTSIL